MQFKFIDEIGEERTAKGLAELLTLFKAGTLGPETLVFDNAEGRWRPAREIQHLAARV